VVQAHPKAVETSPAKSSLTPCILDDDPAQLEMLAALVASLGYEPITTASPEEALKLVQYGRCRLVLADVHMPGMDGYQFLDAALRNDPGLHVIIMTGDYTLESALDAIRRGATDFLPKPIDRARLKRTLDDVAALYDQRRRVRELEEQLLKDLEFHGIVGKSPAMLEVFDFARKVARHYTNVLLIGATGTGKELVARAIHQISPVSQQKLAVCNCSAMVDTLLESQLFGHIRGSFTGATDTRPGLFEFANNETVFLDEVGETSLAMQAKLLRVIQNREIQRVGSPEVRQINVRLIAATNRDLRAEVLAGRFREDLYYRLSSIQIRIPPLTERLEDIPLLVQFFLKKYNEAYGKTISGLTPPRASGAAAACVARERARTGERYLQRLHHDWRRLHRPGRLPGRPGARRAADGGGRRVSPLVSRRNAQDTHPSGSRYVPGESPARRAGIRYRAHELVPVSERRCARETQGREIRASLGRRALIAFPFSLIWISSVPPRNSFSVLAQGAQLVVL